MKKLLGIAIAAALLSGCATNPGGRKILKMVDDKQMAQLGLSAFDEIKAKGKLSQDGAAQTYIQCVAKKLIAELPEKYTGQEWEVLVFDDETPNAFALPGGKVGVHTGIMKVAASEAQLAAVIGHELTHVTYSHGAERVSQQLALQTAAQAAQVYQGVNGQQRNAWVDAAIGIGGQLGVLLPFSRKHETEADTAGQELMAKAGYDPTEAAALWARMMEASKGGTPPQWLSTHPNPAKRMERLADNAPSLMPAMEAARAAGKGAPCR